MVGDRTVATAEGVRTTEAGAKVQKAWLDLEVVQCGYCQNLIAALSFRRRMLACKARKAKAQEGQRGSVGLLV